MEHDRFKGNHAVSAVVSEKELDKKAPDDPSSALLFHYVLQTHLQNGADMVVCQRIEDIFAVPVAFDQMHLF